VLDDRYHLDQIRSEHNPDGSVRAVLWRAVDESLDRRVAVLLVTGLDKAGRTRLTDAATRASQVGDSRFVRVLDVGSTRLHDGLTLWLATEWVEAPSLAALVRDEPLRPAVATEVVRQCAEALAVAERDGLSHGRLHPDQVLIPAGGLPRITGLEIAAALHGGSAGDGTTDDARGLGGLLFTALTGCWPLPDWHGLPAVDPKLARQGRPRLVRAGIGRDLDDITYRALAGDFADARAVARALATQPTQPLDAAPAAATARPPARWQRWAWRLVPPLLVLAIGIAGWALGSDLGRVPTTARQVRPGVPPLTAAAPGSGPAALVWSRPPDVTAFDPEGDGAENDDTAGLAVDRDATTSWTTAGYRDNPHFGGLKSGVGLLIDLGRTKSVRLAELALSATGADVELRAGDTRPQQATDLPLIAVRNHAAARTRMALSHPTKARFWLVWFTSVPRDQSVFRIGVAEIALLG
jgi:hypothetical protein